MSEKLTRKKQLIFAKDTPDVRGDGTTVFGLAASGNIQFSKDVDALQSNSWQQGLAASTIEKTGGSGVPLLEDFNTIFYTLTRNLAYLYQQGLAEWDANQTYFIGNIAAKNGIIYVSLTDNNTNHDPANDTTNWKDYLSVVNTNITNLQTNLSTANTNITNLQTNLSTANTNITNLQTNLSTANTNITNLSTGKQDKLTAGDNITIDSNNKISAASGGGIIETGNDANGNFYIIFSNGLCIQCFLPFSSTASSTNTLTFLKSFRDTNYVLNATLVHSSGYSGAPLIEISGSRAVGSVQYYHRGGSVVEFTVIGFVDVTNP